MIKRAEKFIILGMAIYITILFMIVVPSHHHEDNAEHSDCNVCAIAHQPNLAAINTISLIIIISFIFVKLFFPVTIIFSHTIESFQSRAPPVLNSSH